MRFALLAAVPLLAACAGPINDTGRGPSTASLDPGTSVRVNKAGPEARQFAEHVAARCLLDGVVGGAAMVVDRATGRVIIVGDHEELVAIDIVPLPRGESRLSLSGPATQDPQMRQAMLYQIERAARTGDTSCPILPA